MRLLLDTHALLWWLSGSERLPGGVRDLMEDEGIPCYVSSASTWEIAIKAHKGQLPLPSEALENLDIILKDQGFRELPMNWAHTLRAGGLPTAHRDPFDRMLVAQALVEGMTLVSNEALFDGLGVKRIW